MQYGCKKPLNSVDRLRQAMQVGVSVTSTIELLTHLLVDQADVLVRVVCDTMVWVDKIEDDLRTGRLDSKAVISASYGVCWCPCNA